MTRIPSLRSLPQVDRQNPPVAADPPKAEPRMCSLSSAQLWYPLLSYFLWVRGATFNLDLLAEDSHGL